MKNNIKITYLFLIFSIVVFPLFLHANMGVADHFNISDDVSGSTKFSKDLSIFFDYSDSFYTLPDNDQPSDIFHDSDSEVWDPLEFYNRVAFSFNIYSGKWIIQPLSMTYSFVIPKYVREGIKRVDDNIQVPGRLINSLLQLNFERACVEVARFGINTTAGILGFFDPAYAWLDMEPRINNFGQTFAYWGIGKGFYLILPVYGSTCLRDGVGLVGDYFTNPYTWIPPYVFFNWISWGIKVVVGFNNMTLDLESYLRVCESSVDPYETVKIVWTIVENLKDVRTAFGN